MRPVSARRTTLAWSGHAQGCHGNDDCSPAGRLGMFSTGRDRARRFYGREASSIRCRSRPSECLLESVARHEGRDAPAPRAARADDGSEAVTRVGGEVDSSCRGTEPTTSEGAGAVAVTEAERVPHRVGGGEAIAVFLGIALLRARRSPSACAVEIVAVEGEAKLPRRAGSNTSTPLLHQRERAVRRS